MDAKEFITERNRMCDYYGGAARCKRVVGETTESCPLLDYVCVHLPGVTVAVIDEVEKWSKTHPKKTRQDEFLKMFPNAKMWTDDKFLRACPKDLDSTKECSSLCYDCCKKYWGEEIE